MGTTMASLLHHLLFTSLLLLCGGVQLEDIANVKHGSGAQRREPKLFYVSYSSTTSTVSTASICYFTSGAVTTCGRRRRRMAVRVDPISYPTADINPSRQQVSEEEFKKMEEQIEAGEVEGEEPAGREGRFLLYWLTTTTTTTSFTATSSIGSIYCTPAGYTNVLCGK